MLVRTEDGDERLVPAPAAPMSSLVGARVLLANDYDWVVAIEPMDPSEGVVIDLGGLPQPAEIDLRPIPASRVVSVPADNPFDGPIARHKRRRRTHTRWSWRPAH